MSRFETKDDHTRSAQMIPIKSRDVLAALRRTNPRHSEGFAESVDTYGRVADEVLAEVLEDATAATATAEPRRHPVTRETRNGRRAPTRRPRRRVLGLSAAGLAVIAAGVVAGAVLLAGGGQVVSPAYAAEAVKKAAADTSAAAHSGVIKTEFFYEFVDGGGDSAINTFSWNGDNVALIAQNDPQRQIRYVDGRYYQTYGYNGAPEDNEHIDEWLYCTDYDEGGAGGADVNPAIETPNPVEWLIAARTDLAGEGLVQLIAAGEGYTQRVNDDGSTTYAGTVAIGILRDADFGAFGLNAASQPGFKVDDPNAPVSVQVTVGPEGLISQFRLDWRLDRPGEVVDFTYMAVYEQLGSAPEITAPNPEHTVTTDNPFPKGPAGEI
jgi:hypothetical protein